MTLHRPSVCQGEDDRETNRRQTCQECRTPTCRVRPCGLRASTTCWTRHPAWAVTYARSRVWSYKVCYMIVDITPRALPRYTGLVVSHDEEVAWHSNLSQKIMVGRWCRLPFPPKSGYLRFMGLSPTNSHTCWTPWSVFQDGSVGSLLPAS